MALKIIQLGLGFVEALYGGGEAKLLVVQPSYRPFEGVDLLHLTADLVLKIGESSLLFLYLQCRLLFLLLESFQVFDGLVVLCQLSGRPKPVFRIYKLLLMPREFFDDPCVLLRGLAYLFLELSYLLSCSLKLLLVLPSEVAQLYMIYLQQAVIFLRPLNRLLRR